MAEETAECANNLKNEAEVSEAEKDPYAYLDKTGFTSEKFKIEIRNLPKYYGIAELKKLLNDKLKLASNKVKVPKNRSPWVFVCFRCEEDKQQALKVINGLRWKKQILTAESAKAAPDPLVKRRNESLNSDQAAKRLKIDPTLSAEESLKNNATPLWRIPYHQQLEEKTLMIKDRLKSYAHELSSANRHLKPWVEEQCAKYNGLPCQVLDVVAALDKCDGYRNKCEFTIGTDPETNVKTIGFRLGSYAAGTIGVGSIQNMNNIGDRMKKAVQVFETFIRNSDLPVFNPETHCGSWRQLTARHGVATDELMLIVGVHPQQMDEQQLESVKNDLKKFFESGEGKDINLTSLYFEILRKKERGEKLPKPEHLLGEKHIIEELCGLRFKVTPEIFFQVNTPVAELLYDSVRKLANLDKDSTLIDVCCGTGTIGLCLAKECGQVLGLEVQEEAIRLAKENAAENKIENCSFFSGKAEEILSAVICKATKRNIVAVLDPPRAGLQQKGVILLRRATQIKKVVYLACHAKAALKNIVDLGRPASKTLVGDPFVPTSAVLVDMFPHTNHCELVICLERIDPSTVVKQSTTKSECATSTTDKEENRPDDKISGDKVKDETSMVAVKMECIEPESTTKSECATSSTDKEENRPDDKISVDKVKDETSMVAVKMECIEPES